MYRYRIIAASGEIISAVAKNEICDNELLSTTSLCPETLAIQRAHLDESSSEEMEIYEIPLCSTYRHRSEFVASGNRIFYH